jgi:hypothetical protein
MVKAITWSKRDRERESERDRERAFISSKDKDINPFMRLDPS